MNIFVDGKTAYHKTGFIYPCFNIGNVKYPFSHRIYKLELGEFKTGGNNFFVRGHYTDLAKMLCFRVNFSQGLG